MSRPQVTITLGRSGQVVKRAAPVLDTTDSVYVPPTRSKRPISERLGNAIDNPKRQRRDDLVGDKRYISNARIGRDDLRFKLKRKQLSRRTRSDVDLREKLSRAPQAPYGDDLQEGIVERKGNGLVKGVPPRRSADMLQMDSLRKSSARALDGRRHRSPDRVVSSSRGISPTRNLGELRQRPPARSMNASRSNPFSKDGAVDTSRLTSFMTKTPVSFDATKPVMQLPPPTGMIQKSSYAAEEPLTVSELLHSLGLGKYSILFQAEEVDMTALKQMGDSDLKELGIPMGPRKKILLAVLPRSKQRQSRVVS